MARRAFRFNERMRGIELTRLPLDELCVKPVECGPSGVDEGVIDEDVVVDGDEASDTLKLYPIREFLCCCC